MLITIDHGNKQIKTKHRIFPSGLVESDMPPAFGEDILYYKGKYYTLTDERIPYMRDKTADRRYFILTLFAISYEIMQANRYTKDELIEVQLAVGLPPAHFGAQYQEFEEYFKLSDIVEYTFQENTFNIFIGEVMCFPQAYSAALLFHNDIFNLPKVFIIDIGGVTADYLQMKKGQADLSTCDSMENGVIALTTG